VTGSLGPGTSALFVTSSDARPDLHAGLDPGVDELRALLGG
jgi:hypothetical protein